MKLTLPYLRPDVTEPNEVAAAADSFLAQLEDLLTPEEQEPASPASQE